MNEQEFLSAILSDPRDAAALLVYSDWLCEYDDPLSADKAEYLRLSAASSDPGKMPSKKTRHRMQKLAAKLETAWLAMVSRLRIENCTGPSPPVDPSELFEFACPKQWEKLHATDNPKVRTCDACQQNVYYCETIDDARERARYGQCVAVDLGIARSRNDLQPPLEHMLLGVIREPLPPIRIRDIDPVSREREARRRAAKPPGDTDN